MGHHQAELPLPNRHATNSWQGRPGTEQKKEREELFHSFSKTMNEFRCARRFYVFMWRWQGVCVCSTSCNTYVRVRRETPFLLWQRNWCASWRKCSVARTREQRVYTFINLKNTCLLNVVDDVYGCLVAERNGGVCRRVCDVDKTQTLFILHTAIECINGKMFSGRLGLRGGHRMYGVRYGVFFLLLLLSFMMFMYSRSAHFFYLRQSRSYLRHFNFSIAEQPKRFASLCLGKIK